MRSIFGWVAVVALLTAVGFVGVVGVVLIATRRADMATRVPFGTMLAASALVASVYGDRLVALLLK